MSEPVRSVVPVSGSRTGVTELSVISMVFDQVGPFDETRATGRCAQGFAPVTAPRGTR
jgi:hypothetical protein